MDEMKKTRLTEEQIIGVLKEAEAGAKTAAATGEGSHRLLTVSESGP